MTEKLVCFPRLEGFSNNQLTEVQHIYKALGGILRDAPFIPRSHEHWDIEVDGFAIELDENAHFNRYRKVTLQSSLYSELTWFPKMEYLEYCEEHEADCRGYGGYWDSDGSAKQFGIAAPNGDFQGNGSPRWKQRAFYDFVKDFSPLTTGVPLARISVWDCLLVKDKQLSVDDILDASYHEAGQQLFELAKKRANIT